MSGSIVRFPGRPGRRVVTTFPLSASALDALRDAVGEAVELIDIRAADGSETMVVVSSTSPQLLGRLRTAFPAATLFVAEVEDQGHRVGLGGPVMRALDAGAHGYLVARSVEELGQAIARAAAGQQEQLDAAAAAAELPQTVDDELDDVLDAIIRGRIRGRRRVGEPRTDES